MSRDQRHLIIVIALMFGIPLVAWGGCLMSDPLFGNDPMVFYGQVLDEQGQPIQGARIDAVIRRHRRIPNVSMGLDPSYMQSVEKQALTDSNGRFEVRGKGYYLSVKSIDGVELYYWDTTAASSYDFPWIDYPPGLHARPDDPDNPVLFRPHTERLTIRNKQR